MSLQFTVQHGAQFIQRFRFHIFIGPQPPDGLAVDAALLSELVSRHALLLHNSSIICRTLSSNAPLFGNIQYEGYNLFC